MKITWEMIVASLNAQIIVMVSVVNAKLMVMNRNHAIVKKIQMVHICTVALGAQYLQSFSVTTVAKVKT
jgi:hypothetical protein